MLVMRKGKAMKRIILAVVVANFLGFGLGILVGQAIASLRPEPSNIEKIDWAFGQILEWQTDGKSLTLYDIDGNYYELY